MTDAGPWSNKIQCNKTNVTRRQANQGTEGDEGAWTFHRLESGGVSVCYDVQMYLESRPGPQSAAFLNASAESDLQNQAKSIGNLQIKEGQWGQASCCSSSPPPSPNPTSWQAEVREGQGQPEQGGERAQSLLRNKDRAHLGRTIRCGPRNSGENMLSKVVGLENGKPWILLRSLACNWGGVGEPRRADIRK